MLLRSLSKHVKEQNWFAVVLDFVIVVAGILIALQISNWNEARKDLREERVLRERLEQEFGTLETLLAERMSRAEGLTKSTGNLIELIRRDVAPDDEVAVRAMIRDALRFSVPAEPPTTFVDALQSGRIGRIRDRELRRVLNEYQVSSNWFASVRGPADPQYNPHSRLLQSVTIGTDEDSWREAQYGIDGFDWPAFKESEEELAVIQRRQRFQQEAYRLEMISVKAVLKELRKPDE